MLNLAQTAVVAYIGPGAGLGAILLAVALGLGVLLLLAGLVWYPLKRLFRSGSEDHATRRQADGEA